MKDIIFSILNSYLLLFPEEKVRQSEFLKYLENHNELEITDWNNFDGHIVASGFIYAKKDEKFLVMYHNDLKMFLYPGGHIDKKDINPLAAAKREVFEETGLTNFEQLKIADDSLIPIDIDTHKVAFNDRLKLPEHVHFDFRYLFMIDSICDIKIDKEETSNYEWIDMEQLNNDTNYGVITAKIFEILGNIELEK